MPECVRADRLFDIQLTLAKKGNVEAQFKLGEMYEDGRGVDYNRDQAIHWYEKAVTNGHVKAGYKLLLLDAARNGISSLNRQSFENLKDKASEGDHYASFYLGKMYAYGIGVKRNLSRADKWLSAAVSGGVIMADLELQQVKDERASIEKDRVARQKKATREKEKKASKAKKARKTEQKRQRDSTRRKLEAARKQEEKRRQSEVMRQQAEEDRQAASRRRDEADRRLRTQEAALRVREEELRREEELARKERRRAALLEQRRDSEQKGDTQFESDPCSGRSARFLSTCR